MIYLHRDAHGMDTPLSMNVEAEAAYKGAVPDEIHELGSLLFTNSLQQIYTPMKFVEDPDGDNRIELAHPVMVWLTTGPNGMRAATFLPDVYGDDITPTDCLDGVMASFRKAKRKWYDTKKDGEEYGFLRYVLEG